MHTHSHKEKLLKHTGAPGVVKRQCLGHARFAFIISSKNIVLRSDASGQILSITESAT